MALNDISVSAIESNADYPGGPGVVATNVRGFSVYVTGNRHRGYQAKLLVQWDEESDAHVVLKTNLFGGTIGEIKDVIMQSIRALGVKASVIAECARKHNYTGNLSGLNRLKKDGFNNAF